MMQTMSAKRRQKKLHFWKRMMTTPKNQDLKLPKVFLVTVNHLTDATTFVQTALNLIGFNYDNTVL
jgi:hypothetical protein